VSSVSNGNSSCPLHLGLPIASFGCDAPTRCGASIGGRLILAGDDGGREGSIVSLMPPGAGRPSARTERATSWLSTADIVAENGSMVRPSVFNNLSDSSNIKDIGLNYTLSRLFQ
jgi:hypothetical protein